MMQVWWQWNIVASPTARQQNPETTSHDQGETFFSQAPANPSPKNLQGCENRGLRRKRLQPLPALQPHTAVLATMSLAQPNDWQIVLISSAVTWNCVQSSNVIVFSTLQTLADEALRVLGSFANMGGQQHCFKVARHVFTHCNSWSCSKQPDSKVCQPSICFILPIDPLSSADDYLMNDIMVMISKQLHAVCVCWISAFVVTCQASKQQGKVK